MYSRRRLIFVVVCVFMIIVLSACGRNDNGKEAESSLAEIVTGEKSGESASVELPGNGVLNLSGENEAAKLPDDYPSSIFPVFKDSFIESVLGGDGGFTIVAYSKDDYKDVTQFYKDILREAEVISETEWEDGFTSFGSLRQYAYNIGVNVSDGKDGYITLISIDVMPE